MYRHAHSLLLLILLAVSAACSGRRELRDALMSADAIMSAAPDSALTILSKVDTLTISDFERAHYNLLRTKAMDKAYLDPKDISSIDFATDIFKGRNDSLEAQALYYKGVVLYNNADYGRALVSLMQAHEIADQCGDLFYKAMSSRSMSDVYGMVVAFDAAVKSDSISIEEFIAADRPLYAKYQFLTLPHYLIRSGRIEEANKVLDHNAEDSFYFETPERKRWYYTNRALACYENEDYQGAVIWYEKCINVHPELMVSNDWGRYALCKLKNGDFNTAYEAWDSATVKANEWTGHNYVNKIAAKLEYENKNYKKAYDILYNYYSAYNKLRNPLMSHPYTTVLTDYLEEVSSERFDSLRSARSQRNMMIIIAVLFLLASVSLCFLFLRQNKLKQIEIENLFNDIALLKDRLDASQLENRNNILNSESKSKSQIISLESSIIKFLDQLYVIDSQSPNSEDGNRYLRKTFNLALEKLKEQSVLNEIEKIVNASKGDIIKKLRSQITSVSKKQSDFFMLKLMGFSNTSICSILSINTINALHQLKSRLKNNIINSDAVDKSWFLDELEAKRPAKF